ncbi:MAG TPA: hypothetical protein VGN44_12580 [Candidatus Angelobacter sp.]|jgi:xanthine/uracil permease
MDSIEVRPAKAVPRGMTAMGSFLFFGAAMAFFAGATLVWPGTPLDRIWELNPRAYRELSPLGRMVGIPFLFLGCATLAGIGWFKRKPWGWQLAVAIIAVQVAGDLVNAIRGHIFEGLFGATITGALLFYLLRPSMRAAFKHDGARNSFVQ